MESAERFQFQLFRVQEKQTLHSRFFVFSLSTAAAMARGTTSPPCGRVKRHVATVSGISLNSFAPMADIVLPIAKPKPTGKPEVTEDGPDVPATRPPGLPDNDDDDEPEDGAVRLTVLYMVES